MNDGARGVFVVAALRTPIGRFLGSLRDVHAVDLGAHVTRAMLEQAGVAADRVDEVFFGNARQAGNGPNPARQVTIAAGLPESVPATTVNMACASALKSIEFGARAIIAGDAEVVVAGGTECMSRVPHLVEGGRRGHKLGHTELVDVMYRDGFLCRICGLVMGETAEVLASEYGISREDQDAYACESQRRAAAAQEAGRFKDEMVPVPVRDRSGETMLAIDEHPRPQTTMEALAELPAVFKSGGSVTAGNSSGLVDGAAGVLLASERFVRRAKLEPLARVVELTSAGVDPVRMGIGPVPAVRRLLERTGLELDQIGLIELNEAFAAQVIAVNRDLGLDPIRVNVLGGAIALGHPIGATGARIVVTLLHELRRRQLRHGLATLCVSGGQGMAALFEAI